MPDFGWPCHAIDQFAEPGKGLSTVHVLTAMGLRLDHNGTIARNSTVTQGQQTDLNLG